MDSNNNKKIRPADILAEESLSTFKKKYFVIGRGQITSWKAWLVIGIMAGITTGVAFVASNTTRPSGIAQVEFEASEAKQATRGNQQAQPLEGLNSKLKQTSSQWKSATNASQKSQTFGELKNIVFQRNEVMLALMESDPETANAFALAEGDSASLPSGLRDKAEKQIEAEGTLEILHYDMLDAENSITEFYLTDAAGKKYKVHFSQVSLPLVSNSKIRVKGIELEGNIAALGETDGGVVVLELAVAAPEAENAVVLLVNFLNNTSQPWSVATVNNVVFNQTASYYLENSFGKRTLTGDIFGYYTLPINKTCNIGQIRTEAIKAADSTVLFTNYTQFIFAGPFSGCGWAGVAYVGDIGNSTNDGFVIAGNSWIASMTQHVVGHELGHTFGVWHANFYDCDSEILKDTGCSSLEYGDNFDIMGLNVGHMNAYHKEKLGFFDAANIVEVSSSGSYTIQPIENNTTAPQILKIKRDSSKFDYIEYRQPIGVDSPFLSSVLDGAMIHIAQWFFGSGDTQLLDMTPTATASRSDVTLEVGKSFTDPGVVTITPTSQSGTGLTMNITVFPPVVDVKVNSLDGPLSIVAPAKYSLSWSSNSSICTKSGSWSGSGGSTGFQSFVDVLTAGTYTYTVTCSNGAGSTSDSVTVVITDPTVPPIVDVKVNGQDGPVTFTAPASFFVVWDASYATGGCINSGDWTGAYHSSYVKFVSSMPIGTYTYNVICSNPLGTASDSVVVNVVAPDTTPPAVSITSPVNGATVSGVTTVAISATDASGVSSVAFHIDGIFKTTLFTAPYVYSWDTTSATNGPHILMAIAHDSFQNSASTSITVTVDNFIDITPPTTSITSPAAGAIVSGTVTISATTSDNVGVATVEFLADGVLLGTDTVAPYSFSWDTTKVANGSHTLKSRATDTSGNIGESASVSVTVSNVVSDTTPPTVSITNPLNGSTVARRSSVTITASASDNIGVTKVEFYVNGTLTCADTILPYGCIWKVPVKPKATYTIQAKAYDAAGNTATHSVSVTAK